MKTFRIYTLLCTLLPFFPAVVCAQTGNIDFSDALVKSLCVEAWDSDGDGGLSYAEAASVTDLGTVFKGSGIETFDELRYFTSLLSVSSEAFRSCYRLRRVTLPPSVERVASYAFHSCSSLREVILNEGLTELGNGAFVGCSRLEEIVLPSTLRTLETNVFYECSSLSSVNLPEGLTSLPARVFLGCRSLRSIIIPQSVLSLASSAFSGCSSLAEVTMPVFLPVSSLPLSVVSLHLLYRAESEYATLYSPNALDFGSVSGLEAYAVPSFSGRHVALERVDYASASTGLLVHGEAGATYEVQLGTAGLPAPGSQSVRRVQAKWHGDAAVDSLSQANDGLCGRYTGPNLLVGSAEALTLPGLKGGFQNFVLEERDGRAVFSAVSSSASLPAHSAYLQLSYADVVGIVEMTLPSDTLSADNIFFADPEVRRICVEAWDSDGDGELSFAEAAAVTSLGTSFRGNKKIRLFNELKYFTSLTQIGEGAFYGCSSLTSVMLPPSLRTIGPSAFYGCFVLSLPQFGDKLTTISSNAFTSCTAFTEVELPSSVRTIGTRAFYFCTKLTKVVVPEGVSEIQNQTFSNCTSLTTVTLPNSLTSLSANAFINTRLTTITLPAHIDASVLPSTVTDLRLTVRMDAAYSTLCSPNALDFSGSDELKAYTATTLRGGNLYLDQVSEAPAHTGLTLHGTAGTEYVVRLGSGRPLSGTNLLVGTTEGLTLEPDSTGAQTDLTLRVRGINVTFVPVSKSTAVKPFTAYLHLENALPSGYTSLRANFVSVGNIHFADPVVERLCVERWDIDGDGLLSYDEAASVTDLGDTFKGDTRVRSFMELEYFTGLRHIADSAFTGCIGMTAVMLPPDLTSIGRHAFASCYALTELELPDGLTSIGTGAFRICTGLKSITLPDNAVNLGPRLLDFCTHLTSAHLPRNLRVIPTNMFVNCKRLESIYIPPYVESVGAGAFTGCTGLTTVLKPAVLPDTNIPDIDGLRYYHLFTNEWEAFCAPNATDFSHAEGVSAYAVDSYADGVAHLRPLGDTPAGTGMLLHGVPGAEVVFDKGRATGSVDNLLTAASKSVELWPTWSDQQYYLFSCGEDGVGFIPVTDTVYTAPHSAYLSLPVANAGTYEIVQLVAGDIIVFTDDYVKEVCVELWDTDGDGELSTNEAAAVTELDIFASDHEVRYFDEFRYFTGVEKLGTAAFRNCSSLRRITIPVSLRVIGDYAFDGCFDLSNITFTQGHLERIGVHAFSSCVSLLQMMLPSTVTELGESAFSSCTFLTEVNIPDGVVELAPYTFAACTELQRILIPCSVKYVDETAFSDCFALTDVTLPATLPLTLPGTVSNVSYIHRIEEEYEMFCSPYDLVFPSEGGLLAFTAPFCDGYRVQTERIETVPAGTGVLLHGEPGYVYLLDKGKETTAPFNLYTGVLSETFLEPEQNGRCAFILKDSSNGFGFYRVIEPTALDAYRAYLPLDISLVGYNDYLEVGFLPDIDNPEVQAPLHRSVAGMEIDGSMSAPDADVWYTLTGVCLPSRPVHPGLYLHNGRKEAVK